MEYLDEEGGPMDVQSYGLPGCLNCGRVELHPVFDGEITNFYCPICNSCWHYELGFVVRVPRETCPGCQFELQCRESENRYGPTVPVP